MSHAVSAVAPFILSRQKYVCLQKQAKGMAEALWDELQVKLGEYDSQAPALRDHSKHSGVLSIFGACSQGFEQTKAVKKHVEANLVKHVFPAFDSPEGHIRERCGL